MNVIPSELDIVGRETCFLIIHRYVTYLLRLIFLTPVLFYKQYSYGWVYYEAEPREGDKQDTGNINLKIEQLKERSRIRIRHSHVEYEMPSLPYEPYLEPTCSIGSWNTALLYLMFVFC